MHLLGVNDGFIKKSLRNMQNFFYATNQIPTQDQLFSGNMQYCLDIVLMEQHMLELASDGDIYDDTNPFGTEINLGLYILIFFKI